jgi:hypothetical protein
MDGPEVRASDAERDRAVERLRDAAAEGRLTFEELADRIEVAGGAATRGELEQVTADLPAPVAAPSAPAVVEQASVLGDLRRSGIWTVPERSTWRTVLGDVVLDLREARVGAPEVTIEARTWFGDVDLLVPEGVVVDVRMRTVLGDVQQQAGGSGPPGAPRIVLVGWSAIGDVKIRARRLREKLAERFLRG